MGKKLRFINIKVVNVGIDKERRWFIAKWISSKVRIEEFVIKEINKLIRIKSKSVKFK